MHFFRRLRRMFCSSRRPMAPVMTPPPVTPPLRHSPEPPPLPALGPDDWARLQHARHQDAVRRFRRLLKERLAERTSPPLSTPTTAPRDLRHTISRPSMAVRVHELPGSVPPVELSTTPPSPKREEALGLPELPGDSPLLLRPRSLIHELDTSPRRTSVGAPWSADNITAQGQARRSKRASRLVATINYSHRPVSPLLPQDEENGSTRSYTFYHDISSDEEEEEGSMSDASTERTPSPIPRPETRSSSSSSPRPSFRSTFASWSTAPTSIFRTSSRLSTASSAASNQQHLIARTASYGIASLRTFFLLDETLECSSGALHPANPNVMTSSGQPEEDGYAAGQENAKLRVPQAREALPSRRSSMSFVNLPPLPLPPSSMGIPTWASAL